jgi:hypothetical protein
MRTGDGEWVAGRRRGTVDGVLPIILCFSHGTPRRVLPPCVGYSRGEPNSCCQLFGSPVGANDK